MKKKTTLRKETPEEKVTRWVSGTAKLSLEECYRVREVWQAGVSLYVEAFGMRYEKVYLADLLEGYHDQKAYVVVEWDDSGNTIIL